MSVEHVVLGMGAIGRAVAQELLARGEAVRMVNRSGQMPEPPAGAHAALSVAAADLYDAVQVRAVTAGARVVYQAAQPPYHLWAQKFPALQQAILDGLAGGSAKLVLVENLYMFGPTAGAPITEELPHSAQTRKGRLRSALSIAAFDAHRAGKLRVTAGRGSNYFGPWGLASATAGERTWRPLLAGKPAQQIGNVDLPHTHTYTRDFGRALVTLGERDEADGQAWNVPNDQPAITQRQMVQAIAQALGAPPKLSAMGRGMLMLGGLFIPAAREVLELMYEFEQPYIVDSSKFERAFGLRATPLAEAIHETAAWYRAHPAQQPSQRRGPAPKPANATR